MKLTDIFYMAIVDAERLLKLYDTLLSSNTRAIRSEWAGRFFNAKLKPNWRKTDKLWRSSNDNVLIVGKAVGDINHQTFQSFSMAALLRSALVLYMSAIDKILHEALSKNFSKLVIDGSLDEIVKINISSVYTITQHARIRTGKGGKKKKRPGHPLKAEMLTNIYKDSYLSNKNLEKVWSVCGKKKVYTSFVKTNSSFTAEAVKEKWSQLYRRRNHIVHECDIVRKAKQRRVDFHKVDSREMKEDFDFIKSFGLFLAKELER